MILNLPKLGPVNFDDELSAEEIQQQVGNLAQKYNFEVPKSELTYGEMASRALTRGTKRLGETFGDIIPAMAASAVGADEYAKQQMGEAAATEAEINKYYAPQYGQLSDVKGISDVPGFALENIVENLPNIATSLIPGVGAEAIAARMGAGAVGKIAAQNAGIFLGSYAQNAPEVFQNIYDKTGHMAVPASLIFGAGSAALDSVLPSQLMKNITGPVKVGIVGNLLAKSGMEPGLVRSITTNALKDLGYEGLTEGAQEAISIAAENFVGNNPQVFDSKAWDRIMESSVRGAVAGGGIGVAGGAIERLHSDPKYKQAVADAVETGQPQPLMLTYDPTVEGNTTVTHGEGTYYAFPDGTIATTPDAELSKRYGITPAKEVVQPEEPKQTKIQVRQAQQKLKSLLKAKQLELELPQAPPAGGETVEGQPDLFGAPVVATQPVTEPTVVKKPAKLTPKDLDTKIDDSTLAALGIGHSAILRKEKVLDGKDIANPADAAEVRRILEAYADKPKLSTSIREKVEQYLNRPEFKEQEALSGQPVSEPTGPVGGELQPSVRGVDETVPQAGAAAGAAESINPAVGLTGEPVAPVNAGEEVQQPALGAKPQSDLQKAKAAVEPAVEAQKDFVRQVEDNVGERLISMLPKGMDFSWVKNSDAFKFFRIAPLIQEYNRLREVVAGAGKPTIADEKVRLAKNQKELEIIRNAILDSGPEAAQIIRDIDANPDIAQAYINVANKAGRDDFEKNVREQQQKNKPVVATATPVNVGLDQEIQAENISQKFVAGNLAKAINSGKVANVIDAVIKEETNPETRQILEKVKALGLKTTIKTGKITNKPGRLKMTDIGEFDPATNTITYDPDYVNKDTVVHELVHAAISHTLDNANHPLTKELTALFNQTKKQLRNEYGATNVQEFAAELVSNKAFQDKLKATGNIFQKAVRAIAKFFGFKPGANNFDKGMRIINDMLTTASEVPEARQAEKLYASTPINEAQDEFRITAPSNISKLPPTLRGPVRAIHSALFNLKEAGLGVLLTNDVAQLASKYMPSVRQYVEANQNKRALIRKQEEVLKDIKQQFDKLKQPEANAVNELIAESNRLGKWAYDPKNTKIPVTVDPALAARFAALSDTAKRIVQSVFQYGQTNLEFKKQTIRDFIDTNFAEDLANARTPEVKSDIEEKKKAMLRRFGAILDLDPDIPYAPFKRFGDFVVVAKSPEYLRAEKNADSKWIQEHQDDEQHYNVQFAETFGEAEKIHDELAATGKYQVTAPFKKSLARQHLYNGIDLHKGFAKLQRVLAAERSTGDIDGKVLSQLESMVNELYIMSLAESSARKSEIARKKIAGFNPDMMRSFFTQGMADAHYTSNLAFNDRIMDSLAAMQKEANSDRAKAFPYLNEMMAREAQSLQTRSPSMLDAANRLVGDWYLTFSPSFYLQQATQTYVLSLPWLAGKYQYFKSTNALNKAYKDIFPLVKDMDLNKRVDFSKVPKDVKAMLDVLVGRGLIDIGVESELYGHRTEKGVMNSYNKVTNTLRSSINRLEILNRATAAIAAYRLEMEKSGNKEEALKAANDVVHITHGSYDGFNTPRLFNQGPVSRSITQFRRFQVVQLSMLARQMYNAFKGGTKEEKATARKQIMFLLAHTMALGGMKGMPYYAAASLLYGIAKSLFGDEDDPQDFESWLISQGGELLAHGIPASLGVDVSNKLGMGNVMSILPYTNIDLTSRSGLEKLALASMGPFAGGLLPNMADGIGLMANGDYYKGVEKFMPNVVANGMKGIRYIDEGVTNKRGDVLIPSSEITFVDGVMQALGLPTTTITERTRLDSELYNTKQFYTGRTSNIKHAYERAAKAGDSAAMQELRNQWNILQNSKVAHGFEREPIQNLLGAPQAQAKRERNTIAGVQFQKGNKRFLQQET
jgi:hypothetical protein